MPRPQPETDPALAAVLRRLREARGETQEDVAFGANVTMGSIGRVELQQMNPTWTMVRKLAQALDVSLEELGRLVEAEER